VSLGIFEECSTWTEATNSDHVCPREFRPDEALFNEALSVCGPVLRRCIEAFRHGHTRQSKKAIERAASALTLEQAEKLFKIEGYQDASSKLSLIVPGPRRQIAFARLSDYAETTLMSQVIKSSPEAARRMLNELSWIPDAHSMQGRLWESVGHRILPHAALSLQQLSPTNGPNETASFGTVSISNVGPHYRVGSISRFPVPSQAGQYPRLPTGYFEPTMMTQPSVDSLAVIDQTEEGETFHELVSGGLSQSSDGPGPTAEIAKTWPSVASAARPTSGASPW
jgi:hypothetical protein